jgi:hypothetical protein
MRIRRQSRPSGQCRAFHSRHHRLRNPVNRGEQPLVDLREIFVLRQIHPRAERGPVAGQQNASDPRIAIRIVDRSHQSFAQRAVQRITLLRPVQRDFANPAVPDDFNRHGAQVRVSSASAVARGRFSATSSASVSTSRVSFGSMTASQWPRAAAYFASSQRS